VHQNIKNTKRTCAGGSADVPAKNTNPAGGGSPESGERAFTVNPPVQNGEVVTIKVGCSGLNNNTGCKGSIKDLKITAQ